MQSSPPYTRTRLLLIVFQRAICLISIHTNTLAWLTPRYLYLRNPPIAIGHSHWWRSQTINIQEDKGVIQIVTRKPKGSPHAVSSGAARSTLRNRTGPRRALGATSKQFKSGYRPDLRRVGVIFTVISLSSLPLFHSCLRTRTHPLEPAGMHFILKVGCGHVCQIKPIPDRSRSNSCWGTSSCRYQISYDATLSDSLTITPFLRFTSLRLPLSYEPCTNAITTSVGCPCPYLCSTLFTKGKEAEASEETTGEESRCR